jgi:hypothetical protein
MKKEKKMFSDFNNEQYKSMIKLLVESYLYKPAHYHTGDICYRPENINNNYISNTYPSSLHPYNNGFNRKDPAITTAEVDCCRDLCYCAGVGHGKHLVLLLKGTVECQQCKKKLCTSTCALEIKSEEENISEMYCMERYGGKRCVSSDNTVDDYIPLEQMVSALNDHGTQISSTDDINDIIDMYKILIRNKQGPYSISYLSERIKYPKNQQLTLIH